jgi:hypothetical protein
MIKNPFIISSTDSLTIIQIPEVYQLPEMGGVRDLYKRGAGKAGCSKCRKKRMSPGYLSSSLGVALSRSVANGRAGTLYKALAKHYSIIGPIQITMGSFNQLLKG